MHYEINVSLHGRHFFATAPRSITTKEEVRAVLAEFDKVFTEARGFVIMVKEVREESEYLRLDLLRAGLDEAPDPKCAYCGQTPGWPHSPGCKNEPASKQFR
jgi:hypothetical protein